MDGEPIRVTASTQRVVALLALEGRPILRSFAAATLWPDATEQHAGASLRSALWKINRVGPDLVEATPSSLQLASSVTVDLEDVVALARLIVSSPSAWVPAEHDMDLISQDLLPSWYEDWVLAERERFRQLRLHALESMCERLTALGRFGSAIQAGCAAVAGEPLRESAHRVLISAFLAEGNFGEAKRQYEVFATLLRDELQLDPSPALRKLVASVMDDRLSVGA